MKKRKWTLTRFSGEETWRSPIDDVFVLVVVGAPQKKWHAYLMGGRLILKQAKSDFSDKLRAMEAARRMSEKYFTTLAKKVSHEQDAPQEGPQQEEGAR